MDSGKKDPKKEAYFPLEISRKWPVWENGKSGMNPSKLWQKLKWGHKEGNLAKWQLYENGKFRVFLKGLAKYS